MSKKYLIRTVVAGIIFYFVLELLFPTMSVFLQMLIAAFFFFVVQMIFPGFRRFFSGPDKK